MLRESCQSRPLILVERVLLMLCDEPVLMVGFLLQEAKQPQSGEKGTLISRIRLHVESRNLSADLGDGQTDPFALSLPELRKARSRAASDCQNPPRSGRLHAVRRACSTCLPAEPLFRRKVK